MGLSTLSWLAFFATSISAIREISFAETISQTPNKDKIKIHQTKIETPLFNEFDSFVKNFHHSENKRLLEHANKSLLGSLILLGTENSSEGHEKLRNGVFTTRNVSTNNWQEMAEEQNLSSNLGVLPFNESFFAPFVREAENNTLSANAEYNNTFDDSHDNYNNSSKGKKNNIYVHSYL